MDRKISVFYQGSGLVWAAVWLITLFIVIISRAANGQALDRSPEDAEVRYSPGNGDVSHTNPPAFIWLPVEDADSYIIQYSRNDSFPSGQTSTVRDIETTVHVPYRTLESGIWYWRYGYSDGHNDHFSNIRTFEIPEWAEKLPLVTADVLLDRIPRHRPRLHFSPELVEDIRTDREGKYDYLNTESVIREAEEIIAMDEELFPEPDPWPEDFRPVYNAAWRAMRPYTQRMVTSALAYLYSGDTRFADEARRRLMHFMTWDVDGPSSAIWPTELGMDIAENATPVFDWIYDTLSEEERRLCKEVLTARMDQINRDVHRSRPMESRPYSSHPGRMVGFVIEGGIVLAHEAPEAREWLDYTLKLLWSTYPAWGGDDGGWHEGISYWGSYMNRMFRVVFELDRHGIPLKDKPFFRNTGWFGLYAAYPNRPTSAFGDGHTSRVGTSHGQLMYTISSLYGNPYFRWHADASGAGNPTGRAAIMYHDPDLQPRAPEDIPQSRAFYDTGIVAMHSNMAQPEDNVMMLFKSNPFGAISHNHASQNAFVIEAYGEPLALSSGSRQQHGSPSHREWMWHTKAHNSILVDNEGQVIRRRSSNGEIIAYEDHDDYVFTTGDATAAYGDRLERFHRHVLFLRPDYFVIIDDLKTSGSSSTFQWLLHGPTEIQINRRNHIMVSRSGNARLTSRILTPHNLDYTQHTGFTPEIQNPSAMWNQFHLTVSTVEPASEQRFVTVMRVDRTSGEPVRRPESPSTSRRELAMNEMDDQTSLDEALLSAELMDADGGLAIRLGDDLFLWRENGSVRVAAKGVYTTNDFEVFSDFFKNR